MFAAPRTTRTLRRRGFAAALSLSGLLLLPAAGADAAPPAPAEEQADVRFAWAILASVQGAEGVRTVRVDRDMTLASGDGLRLLLALRGSGHVYVVHRGSGGELVRLYPSRHAAETPSEAQLIAVPSQTEWMRLDERTGTERFYIVGSAEPISRIEALLTLADDADEELRRQIAADFESELVKLRKQMQPLETPAERPAVIGGLVRGMKAPGDDMELTEVSTSRFFLKVLTIEHR